MELPFVPTIEFHHAWTFRTEAPAKGFLVDP